MADVKKYENAFTDEDGKIHVSGAEDVPEGQRHNVTVTQFEKTEEDENGNLKATGRVDDMPNGFRANATVVKRYEKTEEGPDGHLHVTGPEPDFAE